MYLVPADATAWCNVSQTEDDGFSFSKQKYITGYAIDVDTRRFELCIVYEGYQIGPSFMWRHKIATVSWFVNIILVAAYQTVEAFRWIMCKYSTCADSGV